MLDPVEEVAVAEQFGVAAAQVRRDHLISHLLVALSRSLADEVVFFGGTALARGLVPDGRPCTIPTKTSTNNLGMPRMSATTSSALPIERRSPPRSLASGPVAHSCRDG